MRHTKYALLRKCHWVAIWLSNKGHRHFRSRMDAIVQNIFEINNSQLIQYEILEKLVTFNLIFNSFLKFGASFTKKKLVKIMRFIKMIKKMTKLDLGILPKKKPN